jgi:hypothetical protein
LGGAVSYARFAKDSDVYVFLNCGGYLECCACGLAGGPEFFTTDTTTGMLAHLDQHEAAGDAVPESTFDRLQIEAARNDAWMSGAAES